ncbi:hypothetical protein P8H27_17745 [Pseudomonas sp. sp1636]|uniref:hypothetical protein n=1 Tax=Pseudomonas sp. sp1636 TaxID=3036707 RepID=UPI0025A5FD1A|nr:hypothetical protein [Pseudomonas sp. sp1636]MDM8350722.1 hypothetical protein [Pseudomonas sp. sp1636]
MAVANSKPELSACARDRVLFLLQREGCQAAARLAQQLAALNAEGLLEFSAEPRKIGRHGAGG